MKLLIITQKVDINDDILGFFHGWVEKFAEKIDFLNVICLWQGQYFLPSNVKVWSLGKETGRSRLKYIFRFYKYIFELRKEYDVIFVHMNPEYVVLGGIFWKLWNKNIGLWYVHKAVNWKIRIAEKLVDKIFTASKESCRLKSDKIVITGHGIDVNKFKSQISNLKSDEKFRIITAGRIAPVKNYELLIEAAEILKNKNFSVQGGPVLDWEIKIAGKPIMEIDRVYFEKLKKLIKEKGLADKIFFVGAIPYKDIAEFYQAGDLFVNFSDTGSIDKAVLEAMASGLLVLTSNEAFKNILPEKYFTGKDPAVITDKLIELSEMKSDPQLRQYVIDNHDLGKLIARIAKTL